MLLSRSLAEARTAQDPDRPKATVAWRSQASSHKSTNCQISRTSSRKLNTSGRDERLSGRNCASFNASQIYCGIHTWDSFKGISQYMIGQSLSAELAFEIFGTLEGGPTINEVKQCIRMFVASWAKAFSSNKTKGIQRHGLPLPHLICLTSSCFDSFHSTPLLSSWHGSQRTSKPCSK